MDNDHPAPNQIRGGFLSSRGYALSGKIMLSAIVILFFAVVLMVSLHLYARWYLLRAAARRRNLRRPRRTNLVYYVDPSNNPAAIPMHGLRPSVLKSLPVFVFSAETHPDRVDCAVCLSEFEENEPGRVLPKCKHVFHVDCIDMWFHSHDTCPLCRSPVESVDEPEKPVDVSITVPDTVPSSSSGLCETCWDEEVGTSSTPSFWRKPMRIEVPARNLDGFGDDPTRSESQTSHSYRSPMSRMLSFKRMLSRERKTLPSPSDRTARSPGICGGGSVIESDIERGIEETH